MGEMPCVTVLRRTEGYRAISFEWEEHS